VQANQVDALRSLAGVEADEPVVVSLFLYLDPVESATAPARDMQFTSRLSKPWSLARMSRRCGMSSSRSSVGAGV